MALWLVRAVPSEEQQLEALKYDIATIGWNEIPDVSKIKDKQGESTEYSANNNVKKK